MGAVVCARVPACAREGPGVPGGGPIIQLGVLDNALFCVFMWVYCTFYNLCVVSVCLQRYRDPNYSSSSNRIQPTESNQPATPKVYFTPEWMCLLVQSTRNFLSEVLRCAPLPALLRFDSDRAARLALQQRADVLALELRRVKSELEAERQRQAGAADAGARPGSGGGPGGGGGGGSTDVKQAATQTAAVADDDRGAPARGSSSHHGGADGPAPEGETTPGSSSTLPRHLRGSSITLDADAAVLRGDPGEPPSATAAAAATAAAQPVNIPLQSTAGGALASLLATSPGNVGVFWGGDGLGAGLAAVDGSPAGRRQLGAPPRASPRSGRRGSDPAGVSATAGAGVAASEYRYRRYCLQLPAYL